MKRMFKKDKEGYPFLHREHRLGKGSLHCGPMGYVHHHILGSSTVYRAVDEVRGVAGLHPALSAPANRSLNCLTPTPDLNKRGQCSWGECEPDCMPGALPVQQGWQQTPTALQTTDGPGSSSREECPQTEREKEQSTCSTGTEHFTLQWQLLLVLFLVGLLSSQQGLGTLSMWVRLVILGCSPAWLPSGSHLHWHTDRAWKQPIHHVNTSPKLLTCFPKC